MICFDVSAAIFLTLERGQLRVSGPSFPATGTEDSDLMLGTNPQGVIVIVGCGGRFKYRCWGCCTERAVGPHNMLQCTLHMWVRLGLESWVAVELKGGDRLCHT